MAASGDSSSQVDHVLDALFRLPVKNLDSRIRRLESELRARTRLRDQALSAFGTHRLALENALFRLRYAPEMATGSVRSQMLGVEALKVAELRSAFRDTTKVEESLQEAREDLKTAISKRSLVIYGTIEKMGKQDLQGESGG